MDNNKVVSRWLFIGVGMLIIQVLLGGITRLTGSGLSITEWQPILGALPPMQESAWLIAFQKYQQIAQYKVLNADFTLSEFKFIYFWEWTHREWGRLIGVAFLFPFFYFLYKKKIGKAMIPSLIALFILGLAQGLIGWIMVHSGLNNENLYVNPVKLAIHFLSALTLICFTYWFALTLSVHEEDRMNDRGMRKFTILIIVILFFQLMYGAFMAGLKAATVAATWPSINGDYFPNTLFNDSWVSQPLNVHFIHRMLAYLLLVLIVIWYMKISKMKGSTLFQTSKLVPLLLTLLQVLLGICTLLSSTHSTRNGFGIFEYVAQAHQLIAMCLLMSLIGVLYLFGGKKA